MTVVVYATTMTVVVVAYATTMTVVVYATTMTVVVYSTTMTVVAYSTTMTVVDSATIAATPLLLFRSVVVAAYNHCCCLDSFLTQIYRHSSVYLFTPIQIYGSAPIYLNTRMLASMNGVTSAPLSQDKNQ